MLFNRADTLKVALLVGASTSRVIRVRWTRPTQHRTLHLDVSSFRTAHDMQTVPLQCALNAINARLKN